jgi:hypothetical protein
MAEILAFPKSNLKKFFLQRTKIDIVELSRSLTLQSTSKRNFEARFTKHDPIR